MQKVQLILRKKKKILVQVFKEIYAKDFELNRNSIKRFHSPVGICLTSIIGVHFDEYHDMKKFEISL